MTRISTTPLVHSITLALTIVILSCTDRGVEPWPADPSGNAVTILSSGFTPYAMMDQATGLVKLTTRGSIRCVSHSSGIEAVSYSLIYEYFITEINAGPHPLRQYSPEVLQINEDIGTAAPFSSVPLREVRVNFHSRTTLRDSSFTVSIPVTSECIVQDGCEPGITKLYEGTDITLSQIVWANDSKSFFFSVRRDYNEEICRYNLVDRTIVELTPRTRSLSPRDVSMDGRILLVSDNNAKPSGIYSLDLQSQALTLIVPPQDSTIVSSAVFSPDMKRIAFAGDRPLNGVYRQSMWIFNRTDSTLTRVNSNSMPRWPSVTDWTSNDEIIFGDGGSFMSLSPTTLVVRPIVYLNRFTPLQYLPDRATLAAFVTGNLQLPGGRDNHIALFNTQGQFLRQLTFARETIFLFALSPDGANAVFITYRDHAKWLQVYMVSIPSAKAPSPRITN